MSKFLATLLLMSPVGGNLVFLYSTSLDRAQEVLRAAKVIIDWVLTDPPAWAPKFTKVRDNERLVSIHNGRAVNTAVARPKRIESCRGDASKCIMVDEVAFVEREWWKRFLVPLFNNFERRKVPSPFRRVQAQLRGSDSGLWIWIRAAELWFAGSH